MLQFRSRNEMGFDIEPGTVLNMHRCLNDPVIVPALDTIHENGYIQIAPCVGTRLRMRTEHIDRTHWTKIIQ